MCIHVCGEAIVWVGQPKLHTIGFLVLTVAAAATACTVLKIVLKTLCVYHCHTPISSCWHVPHVKA